MKVYTHCIYIPTCSEYALEAIENTVRLKEAFWPYGESSDAIHSPKVDMILCLKPIGRPNTGTEMFMEERLWQEF